MHSADPIDYADRYHRSPCGLLATTPAGVIVEANRTLSEMVGRSVRELVGMPFTTLLAPGSRLFYETRHAPVLHLEGRSGEVALSLTHADGRALPVLLTSVMDAADSSGLVRSAVFPAADRIAYEKELVRAKRKAEASEARVRILQDVSSAFGTSANDREVAETFVAVARQAFAAAEASVLLFDEEGVLELVAGVNPLWGAVDPIEALRTPGREVVLSADDMQTDFPQLADGLRAARFEAISVTPLLGEKQEHLGVLVCLFGRAREFGEEFLDLQRALGRQASQTLVRVRLQRRLERLALTDTLTGLANRQSIEQSLHEAVRDAESSGRPLALVFLDVDAFKAVNDTLGHAAGDEVLRTLADRLRASVRTGDVVGRIGGDEFIAICADADAEGATAVAERIRTLCRQIVTTTSRPVAVSVSVGLAVYDPAVDAAPTPDQLLTRADGAMYVSKGAGKDRVSLEAARR